MDRKTLYRVAVQAWHDANRDYFNSRLPKPRIFIANRADVQMVWSVCKDGRERITISPRYMVSVAHCRMVMLHECIHQLQWQQKSQRTLDEQHGRFFQYHHLRIFGFRYIEGMY